MTDDDLAAQLESLSLHELAKIEWRSRWLSVARPKQVITFDDPRFNTIFIRSGRGWGKTRTAINWLCWELCNTPNDFGHMVGATYNDVRYTLIEGETGILREVPDCLITEYLKDDLIVRFYNGATLRGFTAEQPGRLRGPQCRVMLMDEIASWLRDRETYEQANFGHRLGQRSLALITSTPQPKELIRELERDPAIAKITGHMRENAANLSPTFLKKMSVLEGTRLGRQELAGEILDAEELGVIKRSQWKVWPHDKPLPAFEIVLLSFDTALTEENVDVKKNKSDFTACTAWGGFREALSDEDREQIAQEQREGKKPLLSAAGRPKIILLNAWQERLGFPDLLSRAKLEMRAAYGGPKDFVRPYVGKASQEPTGRKPDILLIEDKTSGISLRQMLQRAGIPVTPYNPGKADKYLRLNLTAPLFVAGYVHAVQSENRPTEFKTWAEPVVAQMCSYSGEGSLEHEDLMDSSSQALLWLSRNWLNQAPPVHRREGPRNSPAGANPYSS